MVDPSSDSPVTKLGRYELVARLASGGMGEIFLARLEGAAGFEKLYVVKKILPHLASEPRFRTMLIDEARIASRMNHPNICQVYELEETDGQLYIVMEYLEGVTILPLLRRAAKAKTPLPLGLVLGLISQTCEALHYAHELKDRDGSVLNIVHRDVTPSNIFVTENGVAKVLDFGIAKVKNASAQTQTGTVKGKYAYMAPEQLRGVELDRRVDVFAIGVVLFEMLSLRRLFQRKTDYLTFRAVMEQPLPDLRRFRQDVSPQLLEVVAHALARDVAERFVSAREFGAALLDAAPGTRAWSNSEIGDYLKSNFAEVIHKRSLALMAMTQRDSRVAGAGTLPMMTAMVSADQESDAEDDEFPSVEAMLDDGVKVPLPPTAAGDFAVQTLPSFSTENTLSTIAVVAPVGAGREGEARADSAVAGGGPQRSILMPILGVMLVGIAGTALFLLWQQSRNHASSQPQKIEIISQPRTDAVDAATQVVAVSADAAHAEDANQGSNAVPRNDAPSGRKVDKNAGSDNGPPRTKPGTDSAATAKAKATKIIQAHLGALNACGPTFDKVVNKDWAGFNLRILADGRVKSVDLEPDSNTFTPFGACVRSALQGITFAGIDQEFTIRVPMRAPS
ncbi:MAG: serine/threonine protein kinase [Kofleriaceae bacterium]|nr:serine/threonine protein kinase [Kofleriaceae bacterium]